MDIPFLIGTLLLALTFIGIIYLATAKAPPYKTPHETLKEGLARRDKP
jgi:hypothetical protein